MTAPLLSSVGSEGDEVYLDWNATAPPLPAALEAMRGAGEQAWGNPSSVHATGRRAWSVVERLRHSLAEVAHVDPRDVLLTSSGTEANNTALRAACALVTSRLEHPSVICHLRELAGSGRDERNRKGLVEPDDDRPREVSRRPDALDPRRTRDHPLEFAEPYTEQALSEGEPGEVDHLGRGEDRVALDVYLRKDELLGRAPPSRRLRDDEADAYEEDGRGRDDGDPPAAKTPQPSRRWAGPRATHADPGCCPLRLHDAPRPLTQVLLQGVSPPACQ